MQKIVGAKIFADTKSLLLIISYEIHSSTLIIQVKQESETNLDEHSGHVYQMTQVCPL